MTDEYVNIGKRIPKKDAAIKATGEAIYTHDLELPGMLHAKILYSAHPHAKIVKIDTRKAEALPGVVCVLTAKDLPPNRLGFMQDNPPLKGDKVRSLRDEVAAVAAVDEDTAERALDLIKVTYEPLPGVFDPFEAMKRGAPRVHEGVKGNKVDMKYSLHYGDVDSARERSDVVIKGRFKTSFINHCCMGTSTSIAHWDRDGRLTLYSPIQIPHLAINDISKVLGVPGNMIRIIQPTIGGAFGQKLDVYPYEIIICHLAKKAGRPVKLSFTREEEFTATVTRQPTVTEASAGAMKDGTLTFRDALLTMDNGAYVSWGATIPFVFMNPLTSLYKVDNIRFDTKIVYTNNLYSGAMRGYGNPQGTFVVESMMDMLAEELNMDPLKIRLKNCNTPNTVTPQGMKVTSCALRQCLEVASERVGWANKRSKGPRVGRYRRGVGIASLFHVGGGARIYRSDGCGAIIKMDAFGKITLITGSTEIGQGSETALAQITAEELGVRADDITVINTNTDVKPWDVGVHASRTTFIAGNAAIMAARKAKRRILEIASKVTGEPVEDLDLKDRKVFSKNDPSKSMHYSKVVRKGHFREQGSIITTEAFYDPPTVMQDDNYRGNVSVTYNFGVQAAEVEVDIMTGKVRVLKIVSAQDVGKAINPMLLEGQMEGGMMMGMGFALLEELKLVDGRVMNPSFLDYKMPTVMDMPEMEAVLVESDEKDGPYGAKGIGEAGLIPTAPAICNAVYDALGHRFYELPMDPESVRKFTRTLTKPSKSKKR
jgi:xanthine dehydrogenase molybdenum-binding subunit